MLDVRSMVDIIKGRCVIIKIVLLFVNDNIMIILYLVCCIPHNQTIFDRIMNNDDMQPARGESLALKCLDGMRIIIII